MIQNEIFTYLFCYNFISRFDQKEYNNLSNHLKHAHKLSKSEVEGLNREKNQEKGKGNQENR